MLDMRFETFEQRKSAGSGVKTQCHCELYIATTQIIFDF